MPHAFPVAGIRNACNGNMELSLAEEGCGQDAADKKGASRYGKPLFRVFPLYFMQLAH